jgi:hypothetical protein
MINVYADLVEAGLYTTDPEKAVDGVRLVPATLREDVVLELESREQSAL